MSLVYLNKYSLRTGDIVQNIVVYGLTPVQFVAPHL